MTIMYIAIWLTIVITLFLLSFIFYLNTKNKIAKLSLALTIPLDNTINSSLDALIEDCFNEYIILNKAYKKKEYISADDEKKISSDLGTMVSNRISETMYNKLSQYYNSKAIPEVISNKIYMRVLNYSITMNTVEEKK